MDQLLKGVNTDVTPEVRETLQNTTKLLQRLDGRGFGRSARDADRCTEALVSVDRVLSSDAPLQHDTREAMQEITRAAYAFRALADYSSEIRRPCSWARRRIHRETLARASWHRQRSSRCSRAAACTEGAVLYVGGPRPENHRFADGLDYGVAIGPVYVPDSVDRPQFVLRTPGAEVRIAEQVRWAEPLKEGIARAVATNLAHFA